MAGKKRIPAGAYGKKVPSETLHDGGAYEKGNPAGVGSGKPAEIHAGLMSDDAAWLRLEGLISGAVTAELDRRERAENERINNIRMPLMVMPPQKGLRDELAAAALTGILTHGTHHTHDKVMADCYRYADEGLKVREVKAEVVEKVEAVVVTPPAGPQR